MSALEFFRNSNDRCAVVLRYTTSQSNARVTESKVLYRQCMLVLMGATTDGNKELIAIVDGYRESEQSWYELLVDLKNRGLQLAPKLAIGDGALGFWAALRKVFGETREQRCWVHKTANILVQHAVTSSG